jgi:acetyltransferase
VIPESRPSNLEAFFNPRTVAVLGASRTAGKAGYAQIINLKRSFSGRICPVNPTPGEILGIQSFTSLAEIPGVVDLAIILLQASSVPDAVRQCVVKEVPAVLIASAGFAEAGPEGAMLQAQIVEATCRSSTRVWGPNCNGLVNTGSGLLASFVDLPAIRAGPIAIVSQTGIFAAAFLNQLMEIPSFGVSKVATLGNVCDINELDVLEYLANDDETRIIALYLEGFRDGRRLFEICRELSRHKPIIALVAGRTAAGAQASMSHTANLAADARITRSALIQAGVVIADEFTALAHLAHAFSCVGHVSLACRVAILTSTGGAGVVAADQLASNELAVAALSADTVKRLNEVHPVPDGAANPLDIWPAIQARGANVAIAALLATVLDDPDVDAAVLIMGAFSGGGTDFDPAGLSNVIHASGKPVIAWLYGPSRYVRTWEEALARIGVPCFTELRTVASALAGINALATYRAGANSSARVGSSARARYDKAPESAKKIVSAVRAIGARSLTEPEGYRLLESFGLRAPAWELVNDEIGAVEAACRIGFPVVVKVVSRQILHKTELGGVVVGLMDGESVTTAVQTMRAIFNKRVPASSIDGFLVQKMVKPRVEVIIGMTRSPQFGPATMLGLGGVLVEAIGRVEFLLPPFDQHDVERMIERTGLGAVLRARGAAFEADVDALCSAVLALGDLVSSEFEIEQIEINPLIVLPDGAGVAAVDALILLSSEVNRK